MQMPDNAAVRNFQETKLGNLLVGRFSDDQPNFFAVRAESQESTGDSTQCIVILTAWLDHQAKPYLLYSMSPPQLLDLGHSWSLDVSIDESQPRFQDIPDTVLIRSRDCFFIRLRKHEGYLDLSTGCRVDDFPDKHNAAYWSAFAIRLQQPGMDGPGEVVFRWPQKSD